MNSKLNSLMACFVLAASLSACSGDKDGGQGGGSPQGQQAPEVTIPSDIPSDAAVELDLDVEVDVVVDEVTEPAEAVSEPVAEAPVAEELFDAANSVDCTPFTTEQIRQHRATFDAAKRNMVRHARFIRQMRAEHRRILNDITALYRVNPEEWALIIQSGEAAAHTEERLIHALNDLNIELGEASQYSRGVYLIKADQQLQIPAMIEISTNKPVSEHFGLNITTSGRLALIGRSSRRPLGIPRVNQLTHSVMFGNVSQDQNFVSYLRDLRAGCPN